MSIEIGQVIIQCDACVARLIHDPSTLPVSSEIPAWSAQEAIRFAHNNGWEVTDRTTLCPSCASEMAAVKFNRMKQGKLVLVGTDKRLLQSLDDEYLGMGGS